MMWMLIGQKQVISSAFIFCGGHGECDDGSWNEIQRVCKNYLLSSSLTVTGIEMLVKEDKAVLILGVKINKK